MRKLLTLTLSIALSMNLAFSQTGIPKAQSLFIYNFTRLIEWPASYKTGDFIVGVYGGGAVVDAIKATLSGKKVGAQNVQISQYGAIGDIGKCHILFVPFSKGKEIEAIVTKLGNQSTLVITERNGMLDLGSMINFIVEGNALKFELNTSAAASKGLSVSTGLTKMAVN